jgi:putative hydrolase of the HAD superfamily
MSDKQEADYQKLIRHLDIAPDEFMMIGNSLKSDVLPVLKLGGIGVHVPYHTTWAHETVEHKVEHENFYQFAHANEVLAIL